MNETKTWDRLARSYDKNVRHFDRSYPRVRELLRTDLADREHVLEVAAGTGQFTFDLAATAQRLTATDLSSEMVQRLQAKVAARGVAAVVCCPVEHVSSNDGAAHAPYVKVGPTASNVPVHFPEEPIAARHALAGLRHVEMFDPTPEAQRQIHVADGTCPHQG